MADASPPVLTLRDLFKISDWQHTLPWTPFKEGVEIYRLYGDATSGPATALLRFQPGARIALHEHTGYEHILVLAGSQVDENGGANGGALIINSPHTRHSVFSENGCIVLAIYEKPVAFLDASTMQEPF
jgi:anti-sigma factor ChrR (cupin superfamily)